MGRSFAGGHWRPGAKNAVCGWTSFSQAARTEWLHRELQRATAGRMLERGMVCFARGRTAEASEVP
jgi:hypothetical protein